MRKTFEKKENGEVVIVEHAEDYAKKECKHQYDVVKITRGTNGVINVDLDCSCGDKEDEPIVSFYNNTVLSAEDNYKGWLQIVISYFIQHGYKIRDMRDC